MKIFFRADNRPLTTDYQKGQALLVIIMVLATALTVVMATTFTSRTDTQISALEAESQKALAAAEAGIETALKLGHDEVGESVDIATLGLPGFTGSANVTLDATDPFTTPLLKRDEMYTYYLAQFDKDNPADPFTVVSGNHPLTYCFGTAGTRPALELTTINRISATNFEITSRQVIDNPDSGNRIPGAAVANAGGCADPTFSYSYSSTAPAGQVLILIRVLHAGTKVHISNGNVNSIAQGTVITSTAKGSGNSTKKVQLFQSYPQLPADFFVTQF